MDLPIIGFSSGWLKVFQTVVDAEIYFEPIDVENHEWEVYDASGHVLDLKVERRKTTGFRRLLGSHEELVHLSRAVPEETRQERLRELLVKNLEAASFKNSTDEALPDIASIPLGELVDLVAEVFS